MVEKLTWLYPKSLLVICFIVLSGFESVAQTELPEQLQENLMLLQEAKDSVDLAIATGDLTQEAIWREELINRMIVYFSDDASAYEESLKLEELLSPKPSLKTLPSEPRRNLTLGILLRNQERFEESLNYFEEAVRTSRQFRNALVLKDALAHVGEVLSYMGKAEEALNHWETAIAEIEGLDWENLNKGDLISRQCELTAVHYYLNDSLDAALFWARKSYMLPGIVENQLASKYLLMSFILLKEAQQYDSINWYAHASLKISLQNGYEREEIMAYDILKSSHEQQGNTDSAYQYFQKFYALEQEQRSYGDALQINRLSLKEAEENAKKQQELANQELKFQQQISWIVSISLVVILLGALFILNRLLFIRKQNKEIAAQKHRAERSEKYKEEFLANMSHEIRTPIHAISGMLKILKRNQHPDFQNKFLNAMTLSTDNLSKLLNDVLDMTKIESGKLTIIHEPFDLADTILQCQQLLEERANEKGLQLEVMIDPVLPTVVLGDSLRLSQILLNLVSNAIKFSDKGIIQIQVTQEKDDVLFEVMDKGRGIPEEKQEQIFSAFEQVDRDRSQGTGLGLTIAKRLVNLLEGTISFKSKAGEGTTFSFRLPLPQAEATSPNTSLSEEALKSIAVDHPGLKILLAEDTEFNVMVASDDLHWYFPEVHIDVATNGHEAVERFKTTNYDLVLMDVQMPEMDGYEATRKIRAYETSKGLNSKPILAMTASVLKEDLALCEKAGMDDYLPKPYSSQDLVTKISTQIR